MPRSGRAGRGRDTHTKSLTLRRPNRSRPSARLAGKGGRGKGKTSGKATSSSAKAGLQFPCARLTRYLRKMGTSRVSATSGVYMGAVRHRV